MKKKNFKLVKIKLIDGSFVKMIIKFTSDIDLAIMFSDIDNLWLLVEDINKNRILINKNHIIKVIFEEEIVNS